MTNRNGLVGEFERFRPRRMTMDELVAGAIAGRRKAEPSGDDEVVLLDCGRSDLVRLRLNVPDVNARLGYEFNAPGSDANDILPNDYDARCARYALRDRENGTFRAVATVFVDLDGPRLSFLSTSMANPPSQDEIMSMLLAIDVPPARGTGLDLRLARDFDVWWEDDAWATREPVTLVAVAYERTCFATSPPTKERVEIFVALDDEHPAGDGEFDEEARFHYSSRGWDRINGQTLGRPGFSSWHPVSAKPVKVIGRSLDDEVQDLLQSASSAPTP